MLKYLFHYINFNKLLTLVSRKKKLKENNQLNRKLSFDKRKVPELIGVSTKIFMIFNVDCIDVNICNNYLIFPIKNYICFVCVPKKLIKKKKTANWTQPAERKVWHPIVWQQAPPAIPAEDVGKVD